MKIASSTWSFHPWLLSGKTSIRELAEKGASLGLDGYEIVDIDLPDTSESGIRSIRPIMSDYGMAISCVSVEHDLSQLSEAAWQADIDKVYQWMEYSLILGTPKLRVFTGWQKQGMTYLEQVKKCRDGLSLLAERAENLGVTLVLENHNDVCRFADELIPLIQEIGSPALKTNPDPFNFGRDDRTRTCLVNQMVFEQTRLMMPFAENIHFKLTKFREDGSDVNMDVPVFMDLFREYDYDGWIAVEFMWPDREKDVDLYQEIRNGAALIRRSL